VSSPPFFYDGEGDTAVFDGNGEDWSVMVNTTGADCRFTGMAIGPAT